MATTSINSGCSSRRALLTAGIFAIALAGCAPWPGEAGGGLAERHSTEWVQGRLMEERYVGLLKAGADARMPARMGEAREMLIRARREHAGGLLEDAAHSLGKVDVMLSSVEREMPRRPDQPRHAKAEG